MVKKPPGADGLACGLAGPRRPWSGSVRDFVLGTRIITGAGKHLRFGGEVMKNVAGYDLSRLMAGSYGCLGVLTEISMKVLPRPRASLSLRREISLQEAMSEIAEWQLQPLPISGLCYVSDNALCICLEGGEGFGKQRVNCWVAKRLRVSLRSNCVNNNCRSSRYQVPYGAFHYPAMRR